MKNKDVIIVGTGFAGAVMACELAKKDYNVTVFEKRNTIGGNMFDEKNSFGVVEQIYGPHIFHTNNEEVFNYLSQYTLWFDYKHKVLGNIKDKLVPIPFNFTSLEALFPKEKADHIKDVLLREIGEDKKVPIMDLQKYQDKDIKELADFVYQYVFHNYTVKQWGMQPIELGSAVMGRVPVYTSYRDGYFVDKYQFMPLGGFTPIFEKMLNHKNITLKLGCDALEHIKLDYKNFKVLVDDKPFDGDIIFTGCVDELLDYKFGVLPYRSLNFIFENHKNTDYQPCAVVNYNNTMDYTRISEFNKFTTPTPTKDTTIVKEIPTPYVAGKNIPYYPIPIEKNFELYAKYKQEVEKFGNVKLLGRLANYKYQNMDVVVADALKLSKEY